MDLHINKQCVSLFQKSFLMNTLKKKIYIYIYTIKNYKIKNLNVGSFFTLSSRPFGLRLIFWVSPIFLESLTTLKDHIENFQQKWGAHFLCKQTWNTGSNIYRLSKTSLTYNRKASPVESLRFWKLIIWYYYYYFQNTLRKRRA